MRIATFLLVAIQALFVLALIISAVTTRSDAAGQGMANAYAMVGVAMFVVLALPALAIASFTGQQWLALALSILGILAYLLSMAMLA